MKKSIFATFIALLSLCALNAQENNTEVTLQCYTEVTSVSLDNISENNNKYDSNYLFKNELAVSYGVGTTPEILNIFEKILCAAMLTIYDGEESQTGAISVEYFRNMNKTVGFGAIVTYEHFYQNGQWKFANIASSKEKQTETNDYISIMPAAKIRWFNKKSVSMYSKIAVGFTLDQKTQKYKNYVDYKTDENGDLVRDDNGNPIPTSDPYTHKEKKLLNDFGFQLSPIGIEAGNPRVRAFAELGFGVQGIAKLGLRCGF